MQGIIILNKPRGITSFGAVARIKHICGTKRVGHTGTLDPMAEGVLPIMVGRATSLCSFITDTEKSYKAEVKLGITTDTEDITGEVLSRREVNTDEKKLTDAVKRFEGDILQVPPMYSALKKDGVRLYKLARQGKSIEREARPVTIHSIDVYGFTGDSFYMDVRCSKGTYIRSLCRDIGEALGCGATLSSLVRTSTAGFSLSDAVSLSELTSENIREHLKNADEAVKTLRSVSVTEAQAVRFSNGGELLIERTPLKNAENGELLRVKYGEILLGIGEVSDGSIKIKCVINDKNGSDIFD